MGVSFSSGRRNQHTHHHYRPSYYHNPPPPPPYVYSSDPAILNPPPPPNNHVYVTSSPYGAANYQYQYPPPHVQPNYYCPGWNNPFNYANPMMGQVRPNYPVNYYGSQGNGWPQMAPPVPLPRYVERQSTKVVKNDVNVHKTTIRLEVDEHNPDHHLVTFVFDADYDGSITIYYFAKEEEESFKFSPEFPEVLRPVQIPFKKGLGQRVCQPSGTGVDLGFFELEALGKPSEDDVFPLVIFAEVCPSSQAADGYTEGSPSQTSPRVQVTHAVIEKNSDGSFQVKVIRQILWIDGVQYEVHELFGVGNSSEQSFSHDDPGKACVICMTEPKGTAVMPCRHLCLCTDCAKELRFQTNKCPICREPITELIEIKINTDQ